MTDPARNDDLLFMYRRMALIRRFETVCMELYQRGRLECLLDHGADGDDGHVPVGTPDLGLAERDREFRLGHRALEGIDHLGLDEDDGVLVADGAFEQAACISWGGGHDHHQAGDVGEPGFEALSILCRRRPAAAALGAEDHWHARLAAHPAFNGRVDDARIEGPAGIHLGYAVGLDEDLVVPVLRDIEALSPAEMVAALTGLAPRARAGRGSFTVSPLGGQGVDLFAPIFNPPEIAMLGIGRARRCEVVEGEAIRSGLTAYLAFVFDHRTADGEAGAAYLATLRELPEGDGIPLT
jgi:hypothetical protein